MMFVNSVGEIIQKIKIGKIKSIGKHLYTGLNYLKYERINRKIKKKFNSLTNKLSFSKIYMLVKKIRLDKKYVYFNGPGFYYELIDWLNKNHFDYMGLIEKGLAIDATNLNIYIFKL